MIDPAYRPTHPLFNALTWSVNADGPAALVHAALAGIQPATVILPAVDLIRLGRDRQVHQWETIASIPSAAHRAYTLTGNHCSDYADP